ncbi:AAA family ATPase [Chitinophaga tropicalis]|uniref:AAA family ATPase n=1 Tax=Chitinophaga tropicalis TaxID=2683588 RepID=A0A7K1TY28_9BACT|nr:AAA family ATPase [Chitinophaga tropicalis]MVT06993.1 AAA family ATPase [Chitinophaga tropicalis]
MKIKKLNIKSYRHLEDVNFDFTYPEGHKKEGLPLDKICIIGQSATGKTGILELFKDNISSLSKAKILGNTSNTYLLQYDNSLLDGNVQIEYLCHDGNLITEKNKISKNGTEFQDLPSEVSGTESMLIQEGLKLLYFNADIISKETIDILNQNPLDILSVMSDKRQGNSNANGHSHNSEYIYEFSQAVNVEVWLLLLSKILNYRKAFTQLMSELINKGVIGDLNRLNKEYINWSKVHENPLSAFAEAINPVLDKLGLEVDLVNTEYTVPIRSKITGDIISISNLSTGTKGLLLSLFPLMQLNTDNAIILLDEPERSLFPDIQIDLMSYYQKLAPNAQFITATHSPFIAAAFEPEERFILYFDADGKVAVRKGESPIGDDPNDMLMNDFKVKYYNEFGKEAYKKYLDLKRRIMQEKDQDKKNELLIELTKLGDKYNF